MCVCGCCDWKCYVYCIVVAWLLLSSRRENSCCALEWDRDPRVVGGIVAEDQRCTVETVGKWTGWRLRASGVNTAKHGIACIAWWPWAKRQKQQDRLLFYFALFFFCSSCRMCHVDSHSGLYSRGDSSIWLARKMKAGPPILLAKRVLPGEGQTCLGRDQSSTTRLVRFIRSP